ncbi:autotransporter domain-containing protein [Pseudomonas sp.]|uniref:autotransporter domain-containing protein n=1 Tax=Pseudomonas sp. TaxID=306 RepID=UPI003982CFC5
MTLSGMASAQTWTGATDTDWNTASNWTGGTPAAADAADINSPAGNQPTLGSVTPALTATNVSAGTLTISAGGELVSTDVNISGSGAIENAGDITGAVSVTDTGILTNNGGSLNGSLSLNDSGSFRTTSSGTIGALNIGAGATATISAATGTTLTQTGAFVALTPSGSLTFGSATDTGRVVMTANGGMYWGDFSVNVAGGTLAAAGSQFASVLPYISSTSVAAGATLDIGSIDTTVQRLGGAGTVTNSSATDRVLTLKNTSTFAGAISDGATNNLSLVRIGTGTTTLTGASGYTGSTTVAEGTLALGTGSSLASTSVTIDAGAELSTNGEHLADGATLSNNGQFTVTGAETIGEINGTGAVTLTDPGVLTIAGAATATISNTFNGTGGLTFNNASGAHTLSGANTHTGATTLEAGGLTLAGGAAIADTGAVVVNGGTLTLSDSETIGALSGSGGAIQLGNNTLTVNATSGSADYAGAISGSGELSKTGAGTLALSGTNTYTGDTTLTAGTVVINNAGALGADSGRVRLDGGTLLATETLTLGKANLSTQSGTTSTIAAANGKTLTLTGNVNPIGSNSVLNFGAAGQEGIVVASNLSSAIASARVNVAGGTLRLGAGEFINSGLGFIAGTSVAGAATLDMAGLLVRINNLSGTGTVNSSAGSATLQTLGTSNFGGTLADGAGTSNLDVSSGVLTLSGGNTYTGTTLLSGGNLTLTGAGALASTDVTINAGRTLTTQGGAATGLAAATALTNNGVFALTGDEEIGSIAGSGAVNLGAHTLTTGGLNSATALSGVVSGTGGLIKSGTGQLTLSGANTYVGQTAVTAGTLDVTGSIASTSVVVEDSASLIADGASLSDAAGVTLNGTGNLTVNSATETIGSLSAATGSTIVLNAGLTVGDTADTTVAGAISGIGALTKAGAGTLLLSGGNTYSGGTTVSAGTLRGSTASLQGNILNNALLDFDQAADGVYAGVMSGTGSLVKSGAGALTLSGVSSYSGATTVADGLLTVNGSIANSATTINTGGALGGSGTFGSISLNGGSLAPGNSIGTMNVAGNVDFSGGGLYQVEVDAAGNSDLISATGSATLTNGTVLVLPEAGDYLFSTDYTILTAAGGLGGTTFNSVSSDLAFLTPTLTYDANNVFLNLRRNSSDYASVTGTPNQLAVGTALDTLVGRGASGLDALLNNLNVLTVEGAKQAYDALSGVQHTYSNQIALQSLNQFKGLLFDRLQGNNQFLASSGQLMLAYNDSGTMTDVGSQLLGSQPAAERGWWLRGTGSYGEIDDTSNASGAHYNASGTATGIDFNLDDALTLGAAFGYSRTDTAVADGSIEVDSYQAALYGRWLLADNYYASGIAGFGYHDIDANRRVTVGPSSNKAEADYDAWTGNIALEAGRKFALSSRTAITPLVGLEYAHIKRSGFTEKGAGAANLDVSRDQQDSLRSAFGARLEHSWTTGNGSRIQPTVELAWVHEFMDNEAALRAGFTPAPNTSFSVSGPELDRDRARLGLGLNMQVSETASLNLGYQGEFAASDQRHDISATFKMMW